MSPEAVVREDDRLGPGRGRRFRLLALSLTELVQETYGESRRMAGAATPVLVQYVGSIRRHTSYEDTVISTMARSR